MKNDKMKQEKNIKCFVMITYHGECIYILLILLFVDNILFTMTENKSTATNAKGEFTVTGKDIRFLMDLLNNTPVFF